MSYFYFNGFYSYEMGLIVEEKSIYNGPQPDFVLTNPEQYRSVPDITVYGTGNIYLNIGYNQYYMEDIRSQIILDGELMHAYSGTTPLNEKIRFTEFPYLRPGDNQISWGGTGRKA